MLSTKQQYIQYTNILLINICIAKLRWPVEKLSTFSRNIHFFFFKIRKICHFSMECWEFKCRPVQYVKVYTIPLKCRRLATKTESYSYSKHIGRRKNTKKSHKNIKMRLK